ncbi:MAG TPA: DUF4340 domain-containing protein [Elusimicrobiales bacterium]|nr:DUF4340 domain-containing protein [Elusimicrobiales bacterium]HOL62688.1 DUF4340 domain-containing protein [Elusimicrobiales bacterium]HPO95024.1 DUF4340 domain-containing protein [Elusimicrobiales bacterium]
MKEKTLILVITSLIIAYFLITAFNKPKTYSNAFFSDKINTKKINQIHIKNKDNEIFLEKSKDLWFLKTPYDYRADNREIENILDKLSNSKLFGPLTDKKEIYDRFEIYPDSATIITLKGDKEISFITGKATMDYQGTFIKFTNSKEIFEARGIFPFDFKKKYEDFIYPKIMESDEKELTQILINYSGKEYSDSKSQEKWVKSETQSIIDLLKEIRFSKIEKGEKDSQKTNLEIILKSPNGEEKILFKNGKNYLSYKNGYKFTIDEPNSKKIEELINKIKAESK